MKVYTLKIEAVGCTIGQALRAALSICGEMADRLRIGSYSCGNDEFNAIGLIEETPVRCDDCAPEFDCWSNPEKCRKHP